MLKLLLSSSTGAMLEAVRVYGNLSHYEDVQNFIMRNKGAWKCSFHTLAGRAETVSLSLLQETLFNTSGAENLDAGPTSAYDYVMFRLHLSARPATVSMSTELWW